MPLSPSHSESKLSCRFELFWSALKAIAFVSIGATTMSVSAADCVQASSMRSHQTINHCPRANAGPDSLILVGSTVILNGADSSDVDGDRLTYLWEFVNRPANSVATITSGQGAFADLFIDVEGEYKLALHVSDGRHQSVDTVTLSTQRVAPIAVAGVNQTVHVGQSVTLDGIASFSPHGDSVDYQWRLVERPPTSVSDLAGATSLQPSLFIDADGEYAIELTVRAKGQGSETSRVLLSTTNTRPIAVTSKRRTVAPWSTVSLDASASTDIDGDEVTATWSLLSAPTDSEVTIANADEPVTSARVQSEGVYIFQLIVNDGMLDSEPVTQIVEVKSNVLSRDAIDQLRASVLANLDPSRGDSDDDGDGVPDDLDNCVDRPNPDQRDTDDDGIGNACDPDLNNDGVVNVVDLGLLRNVFFTDDPDADFDGNGVVNIVDLGILRSFFFQPPGPPGFIVWISTVDGNWDFRENWFPAVVPVDKAFAFIDMVPSVEVTLDQDSGAGVRRLVSNDSFRLVGTNAISTPLAVTELLELGGPFVMSNATLSGATVTQSELSPVNDLGIGILTIVGTNNALEGISLGLETRVNGNTVVRVTDDLQVDGTVRMLDRNDNPSSALQFPGVQTLTGTGVIEFGDGVAEINANRIEPVDDGVLTVAPSITIQGDAKTGGRGTIGGNGGSIQMLGQIALNNSNTIIALDGVIDNQGAALSIDGDEGRAWLLGTVRNATLSGTGSLESLGLLGRLESVVVDSTFILNNDGQTTVTGGLTVNGAVRFLDDSRLAPSRLVFDETQSIDGNGVIEFAALPTFGDTTTNRLEALGDHVLTIGAGLTVQGPVDDTGVGTIGGPEGTIRLLATIVPMGSTGTAIALDGIIDNQGAALSIEAAEGRTLLAGTLRNATITGAGSLESRGLLGRLEAVVVDGTFSMNNDGQTTVTGGLTINGAVRFLDDSRLAPSRLLFDETQSIDGNGVIEFAALPTFGDTTTNRLEALGDHVLTIGAGLTVQGPIDDVGIGTIGGPGGTIRLLATIVPMGSTGTAIVLDGDIDNQGAALPIDAGVGRAMLAGTLRNATITGAGSLESRGLLGRLEAVVVDGTFSMNNDGQTTVTGGLTINGAVRFLDDSRLAPSRLLFDETQSIDGNGVIEFAALPTFGDTTTNRLEALGDHVLTIGAGLTVQGPIDDVGIGTIGGPEGTIRLLATVVPMGNTSTTIILNGVFDNAGDALPVNAAAGRVLLAGTLRDATITGTGSLESSGPLARLESVVVDGTFSLNNDGQTTVTGGLTVNGAVRFLDDSRLAPSRLLFDETQSIDGNGVIEFASFPDFGATNVNVFEPINGSTVTVGPLVTVRSDPTANGRGTLSAVNGQIVLLGNLEVTDGGSLIVIANPSAFDCDATVSALDDGQIMFDQSYVNDATLQVGRGGRIEVNGDYSQTSSGLLQVVWDETGGAGLVEIDGMANLDGTLAIDLNFEPAIGEREVFMTFSTSAGAFATVTGQDIGNGTLVDVDSSVPTQLALQVVSAP